MAMLSVVHHTCHQEIVCSASGQASLWASYSHLCASVTKQYNGSSRYGTSLVLNLAQST